MLKDRLSYNLNVKLKQAGITYDDLRRRLAAVGMNLDAIRSGSVPTTLTVLERLAEAVSCDPVQLLSPIVTLTNPREIKDEEEASVST